MKNQTVATTTVVRCPCGAHAHLFAVQTPLERIRAFACHCNSCRRAGGGLYSSSAAWEHKFLGEVSEVRGQTAHDLDHTMEGHPQSDPTTHLQAYDFGRLEYYFCMRCSAKMYWRVKTEPGHLYVFSSLIPDELVSRAGCGFVVQVWVGDTLDGGLSSGLRLHGATGAVAPRFVGFSHTADRALYQGRCARDESKGRTDQLLIKCHCQKVKLCARPGLEKWKVELDVRRDVQIMASSEVMAWAVMRLQEIGFGGGDVRFPSANALKGWIVRGSGGGFKIYESKDGMRLFCGGCSAMVMEVAGAWMRKVNPVVKLAAGMLAAGAMARSEDILDWLETGGAEVPERGVGFGHDELELK